MTSFLHQQRVDIVAEVLRRSNAQTVLDLGCGKGPLLMRLAQMPGIRRIVGLDVSARVLEGLCSELDRMRSAIGGKVELVHGSMLEPGSALSGFDAAILVETIEHIEPERLSAVERALFEEMRPGIVIITTPNSDFNPLLGVPRYRFRHRDHRFEWGRARFRARAGGVARRNAYTASFADVGGAHPDYGGATQMGVFTRGSCDTPPQPARNQAIFRT